MKLRLAFGWFPVPVIITDDMNANAGACEEQLVVIPYIKVRQKYIDSGDAGILLHKLKHAEQFLRGFPLTIFTESETLENEVEAYKAQIAWYEAHQEWCASNRYHTKETAAIALATGYRYKFSVTEADALARLSAT